ncbi:hypothetical protein F3Y22_tig00002847pilonHSYRG00067 [Hibiscus syriacus]|uniref:Uncharacterized protein n=1 Tax=Hibiscus syriacus TaxID=106335 RepID=A0A6A3CTS6_HIBSY|nr:hypothetical protein F3Y22_tig00002847pilonHSYRG00067 [Hibiscus syriacus]
MDLKYGKSMSHQINEYELLVKELKEELREQKLKAKEEAEDLAQEMAELRYQMTGMLKEECKRRACIEQVSLQKSRSWRHSLYILFFQCPALVSYSVRLFILIEVPVINTYLDMVQMLIAHKMHKRLLMIKPRKDVCDLHDEGSGNEVMASQAGYPAGVQSFGFSSMFFILLFKFQQ